MINSDLINAIDKTLSQLSPGGLNNVCLSKSITQKEYLRNRPENSDNPTDIPKEAICTPRNLMVFTKLGTENYTAIKPENSKCIPHVKHWYGDNFYIGTYDLAEYETVIYTLWHLNWEKFRNPNFSIKKNENENKNEVFVFMGFFAVTKDKEIISFDDKNYFFLQCRNSQYEFCNYQLPRYLNSSFSWYEENLFERQKCDGYYGYKAGSATYAYLCYDKESDSEKFTLPDGATIRRQHMSENAFFYLINWVSRFHYDYDLTVDNSKCSIFRKYFPIGAIGANKFLTFDDFTEVFRFLKHKPPVKKASKKQLKIDELNKLTLKNVTVDTFDLSLFKAAEAIDGCYRTAENSNRFMTIEKTDNVVCIRWFKMMQKADGNTGLTIDETSRLFVEGKDFYMCKKTGNDFVSMSSNLGIDNFATEQTVFLNTDTEIFSGTKLEYYKSIVDKFPKEFMSKLLYIFLYSQVAEALFKQGFEKLVIEYLNNSLWTPSTFKAFLRDSGAVDTDAKSLNKLFGVNKYQLSTLKTAIQECDINPTNLRLSANSMSRPSSVIHNYLHCWHECFGEENIASFTNEQTDVVSKIAEDDIYCWSLPDVISQLRTIYSLKLALSYVDKMLELAHSNETITREYTFAYSRQIYTQQVNAISVYTDYLRMVKAMNAGQTLRPDFSSVQEIGEKHDALVPIFNALKEENNKRAFEERLAKWKKFEYEAEDGKYAIVAPKEPGDLAREGFELHHCVKSYIGSVTEGRTNIVFIRETSDLDKPFFTVEISNENVIQQIHGLGNCNMDVVDGLEKFVKEWTKNKKIKFTKGSGVYGAGHRNIR